MKPHPRYAAAHEAHFRTEYPSVYAGGHYFTPVMPDVRTANGLTNAIVKFLLWSGHRATRISSAGRVVKQPQRQASGVSLMTAKYIPGATRRGQADISATILGRSCQLEIKIGKDRPSEYQLREQALERKAGGCYEFVRTWEEFLILYDKIVT